MIADLRRRRKTSTADLSSVLQRDLTTIVASAAWACTVGDRARSSKQIALPKIDAEIVECPGGRLVFNAFGDRPLAEVARQRDDRPDYRFVLSATRQVAHELDVDLQVLHGQLFE